MTRLTCTSICVLLWFASVTQAAEESYSGITGAELKRTVDNAVKRGWRPQTARGYEVKGEVQYDVTVTDAPGGAWEMRNGITDDTFNSTNDALLRNGYKLSVHSSWRLNGTRYHVAIWNKE